jgi:aminoglycoside/choline kinase family phosphotransferase
VKEIVVPTKTILWCEESLAASDETVVDMAPLRVEASHRCFYRVTTNQRSVVLMDSPPALERNAEFSQIGKLFHERGIPVAAILAEDKSLGLFLLEDLGDVHFEELYGSELKDEALKAAIDLLPTLGAIDHPAIEPYTTERLHMELDIFTEWFVGKLLGLEVYMGVYEDIAEQLVTKIDSQPKCCIHRDYHCRNLLFNDGQLGLVDFQDALHGPVLYDIASLLRDCYYQFSAADVDRWLAYFVSLTPQLAPFSNTQIKTWFDWTAIQRQLKAVGIFARMHLRDGKTTHLRYILPVLGRIQARARDYAELRSLDEQLTSCINAATPILAPDA